MYFYLFCCLLLVTICQGQVKSEVEMLTNNSDTVLINGYGDQNTVGNGNNTFDEEPGQELIEKLEKIVTLQNDQDDVNMVNEFDWIMRKLCQFTVHEGDKRQIYGVQYAIIAEHVVQFCNDLQHNRPTNGVLTQKIYAAKFEIQTNMFKMLDNVKQQIVKQLQRQEKQEVEAGHLQNWTTENSGTKLSMELRNKLLEIATKFEDENLVQKLKAIIEAKKPSEQLALSYKLLKCVAQQHNRHVAHGNDHVRRAKRENVPSLIFGGIVVLFALAIATKNIALFIVAGFFLGVCVSIMLQPPQLPQWV